MIITSFTLWEPRLDHENIIKETNITCVAWKEFGKPGIKSVAVDPKSPDNDREVCRVVRAALAEADVLVHHNGDTFDLPILNSRLLLHGLAPLPQLQTVDTKKVAKAKFRFDSNRLDFLADYLGIGKKKKTDYKLWLRVMNGDPKALAYMVKYNRHDVVIGEKVYERLRPFMTNHPNQRLTNPEGCPKCGKGPLYVVKYRMTKTAMKTQYQCKACGGYSTGETVKGTRVKIS